jgi:GAF domain-containing protein
MEILCVGNDITERIRAEQAQKEALEQAQTQRNISEALATLTDEQAVFETILGEYLYLLRLEQGGIMLLDSTRSQNRLVAQYVDNRVTPANLVFPVAEDRLAQYLIENPFPLVIDDVGTHPLTGHNQARRGPVGSMLLVPIILGGKVIGLIGADAPDKGHVFSPDNIQVGKAIADQLTIWLENRQLAEQTRYHATLLKIGADVSRAASSILDVDRLIETSVNLIRNRFDFYYVGLFLVDEANEWAVLRAGTGQAGQKQIEANHRLKVGGSSMIGWAVVNRQARIALDVGQEAVHFQNPYLPDTRSEMALPLISRDQAIGALTVQSVARSAFSTEDITALQTMADQLANAITNARLYEASRRATRREALIKEITAKVRANTDITGILQTTITEIGAAVGGQRAYIYLTPPPNNNE